MTTKYAVYVNAPGCLPDTEPEYFNILQDAIAYARDYVEENDSWEFYGDTLMEDDLSGSNLPVIVGNDARGFYRISIGIVSHDDAAAIDE